MRNTVEPEPLRGSDTRFKQCGEKSIECKERKRDSSNPLGQSAVVVIHHDFLEFTLLLALGGLVDERLVNVRDDTTTRNGGLD